MYDKEKLQELTNMLIVEAPDGWEAICSLYLIHDVAASMKLFYRVTSADAWTPINSANFDVIDCWDGLHKQILATEGNELKTGKAILSSDGKINISIGYDIIDPILTENHLDLIEKL